MRQESIATAGDLPTRAHTQIISTCMARQAGARCDVMTSSINSKSSDLRKSAAGNASRLAERRTQAGVVLDPLLTVRCRVDCSALTAAFISNKTESRTQ